MIHSIASEILSMSTSKSLSASEVRWDNLTLSNVSEAVADQWLRSADICNSMSNTPVSLMKATLFKCLSVHLSSRNIVTKSLQLLQDTQLLTPEGISGEDLLANKAVFIDILNTWKSSVDVQISCFELFILLIKNPVFFSLFFSDHKFDISITDILSNNFHSVQLQVVGLNLLYEVLLCCPSTDVPTFSSNIIPLVFKNLQFNKSEYDTSVYCLNMLEFIVMRLPEIFHSYIIETAKSLQYYLLFRPSLIPNTSSSPPKRLPREAKSPLKLLVQSLKILNNLPDELFAVIAKNIILSLDDEMNEFVRIVYLQSDISELYPIPQHNCDENDEEVVHSYVNRCEFSRQFFSIFNKCCLDKSIDISVFEDDESKMAILIALNSFIESQWGVDANNELRPFEAGAKLPRVTDELYRQIELFHSIYSAFSGNGRSKKKEFSRSSSSDSIKAGSSIVSENSEHSIESLISAEKAVESKLSSQPSAPTHNVDGQVHTTLSSQTSKEAAMPQASAMVSHTRDVVIESPEGKSNNESQYIDDVIQNASLKDTAERATKSTDVSDSISIKPIREEMSTAITSDSVSTPLKGTSFSPKDSLNIEINAKIEQSSFANPDIEPLDSVTIKPFTSQSGDENISSDSTSSSPNSSSNSPHNTSISNESPSKAKVNVASSDAVAIDAKEQSDFGNPADSLLNSPSMKPFKDQSDDLNYSSVSASTINSDKNITFQNKSSNSPHSVLKSDNSSPIFQSKFDSSTKKHPRMGSPMLQSKSSTKSAITANATNNTSSLYSPIFASPNHKKTPGLSFEKPESPLNISQINNLSPISKSQNSVESSRRLIIDDEFNIRMLTDHTEKDTMHSEKTCVLCTHSNNKAKQMNEKYSRLSDEVSQILIDATKSDSEKTQAIQNLLKYKSPSYGDNTYETDVDDTLQSPFSDVVLPNAKIIKNEESDLDILQSTAVSAIMVVVHEHIAKDNSKDDFFTDFPIKSPAVALKDLCELFYRYFYFEINRFKVPTKNARQNNVVIDQSFDNKISQVSLQRCLKLICVDDSKAAHHIAKYSHFKVNYFQFVYSVMHFALDIMVDKQLNFVISHLKSVFKTSLRSFTLDVSSAHIDMGPEIELCVEKEKRLLSDIFCGYASFEPVFITNNGNKNKASGDISEILNSSFHVTYNEKKRSSSSLTKDDISLLSASPNNYLNMSASKKGADITSSCMSVRGSVVDVSNKKMNFVESRGIAIEGLIHLLKDAQLYPSEISMTKIKQIWEHAIYKYKEFDDGSTSETYFRRYLTYKQFVFFLVCLSQICPINTDEISHVTQVTDMLMWIERCKNLSLLTKVKNIIKSTIRPSHSKPPSSFLGSSVSEAAIGGLSLKFNSKSDILKAKKCFFP